MLNKTLVFVCTVIGLVAGNCFDVKAPQEFSAKVFSLPMQGQSSCSAPMVCDNVFSSGSSGCLSASGVSDHICSSGSSSPCVSDQICSSGSPAPVFSAPVVSTPIVSGSGNCFSEILSSSVPSGCSRISSGCSSGISPVITSVCTPGLSSGISSVCSSGLSSGCSSGISSVCSPGLPSGISSVCSSGSSFGTEFASGPIPFCQAPTSTIPAVELPAISLPSSQPGRVLSQRCICTKTVIKPGQIIQRQITVPRLQRFIKRTYTPVIEHVSYKATPISQGPSCGPDIIIPGSGPSELGSCSSSPVVLSSGSQSRFNSPPVVFPSESSCARMC